MRNVMVKAWEIARNGQKRYGGKVTEYFAQALKIAWSLIKKGANKMQEPFVMIETLSGSRKHKTWVAEITGTHPQYKFNRKFIDAWDEWSGGKEFKLFTGKYYEICDGGDRTFVKVKDGVVERISAGELAEYFA